MDINIERINRQHQRDLFDCGVPELNRFLQQQARQKTVKNIAQTYVACDTLMPTIIVGYHTLTGYAVMTPPNHPAYKKYPHPLHAVKLARLAVDQTQQGQRLGERLLVDAIRRTVVVALHIAAIGLFVDPMTPQVIPFYQQYGFLPAQSEDPACLDIWLPIKTCQEIAGDLGD